MKRLCLNNTYRISFFEAFAFDTFDRLDAKAGGTRGAKHVVNFTDQGFVLHVDVTHEERYFFKSAHANHQAFDGLNVFGALDYLLWWTHVEATAAASTTSTSISEASATISETSAASSVSAASIASSSREYHY